jgi:hypothetical protein
MYWVASVIWDKGKLFTVGMKVRPLSKRLISDGERGWDDKLTVKMLLRWICVKGFSLKKRCGWRWRR